MICWLIGMLLMTIVLPVKADPTEPEKPVPTYVRMQPCLEGDFCITRDGLDRINTILQSEKDCRKNLKNCRDEMSKPPPKQGWKTWEVVLLTIGVGVAAIGLGFGLGKVIKI